MIRLPQVFWVNEPGSGTNRQPKDPPTTNNPGIIAQQRGEDNNRYAVSGANDPSVIAQQRGEDNNRYAGFSGAQGVLGGTGASAPRTSGTESIYNPGVQRQEYDGGHVYVITDANGQQYYVNNPNPAKPTPKDDPADDPSPKPRPDPPRPDAPPPGGAPTQPTAPPQQGNGIGTTNPYAGANYVAYDEDGNPYYIGSDRGVDFLQGAQNGSTIQGADGSTWTKDANGNVIIVRPDGSSYSIRGASINATTTPIQNGEVGRLNKEDYFNNGRQYLDAQRDAAAQQIQLQKDYAVQQGVNELTRAEEDAQQQFQTQRNQVARDEQIGLDNQALYAEARGDKGGIGYAQYAAIQAQAAQNRLAINQAQTKLSTDTARQIADLRAQGEFEAADALLSLTQTYLGQLQQLYENSMAYGLDVDKFNLQLEQWEQEYGAQIASLTGTFNGAPTYAAQQDLANAALALLQAGMDIGDAQKQALTQIYGYDENTINNIRMQAQLAAAGVGSGGSGRGSGGGGGNGSGSNTNIKNDPRMWIYENLGLYASPNDISAALLRMDKSTYGTNTVWDTDGDGINDYEGTLAEYYGWLYGNMSDYDRVQILADAGQELPIDWNSVLKMNGGPMSEDELVNKTLNGDANYRLVNGKLVFYPTATTQPVTPPVGATSSNAPASSNAATAPLGSSGSIMGVPFNVDAGLRAVGKKG